MNCTAKIQDGLGNHYGCDNEATVEIITETFASHLQRNVVKKRFLCPLHAGRLKSRFRYKIKHCGKKCVITETTLNNQ